jgi:hypothetical protein
MSDRKTFCEKYPELCVKDYFSSPNITRGNLGLPLSTRRKGLVPLSHTKEPIIEYEPPTRRKGVIEYTPPIRRK